MCNGLNYLFFFVHTVNGNVKQELVTNKTPEQIAELITKMANQSGLDIIRIRKPFHTDSPSIQGQWHPFTNRPPSTKPVGPQAKWWLGITDLYLRDSDNFDIVQITHYPKLRWWEKLYLMLAVYWALNIGWLTTLSAYSWQTLNVGCRDADLKTVIWIVFWHDVLVQKLKEKKNVVIVEN